MPSIVPPRLDPGTSAFRCKGLLYIELLRYVDERAEGGRDKLVASLPTEELREFVSQPFVVGGWYDVLPIDEVFRAGARVLGGPSLDLLRAVAETLMPGQIKTRYKFILAFASPEMVMNNLGRTAKQFFEFVTTDIKQIGPKQFESSGANVPLSVATAYRVTTEVGLRLILEYAGAKGVKQRWMPNEDQGVSEGVPVVKVRRVVTWD